MKKILLLCAFLALSSCASQNMQMQNTDVASETQKLKVTSSIVPISSIINTIGWDYVEVENIVPAGVSPHGFDLSAKQMASVQQSDVVFMIGLESIDRFLENAIVDKNHIELAEGIELLEATAHEHHDDEHKSEEIEHEDHHDEHQENHSNQEHEHNNEDHHDETDKHENHEDKHDHDQDPHVWLWKDNVITIAQKIESELSRLVPEQQEYFAQNTSNFIEVLTDIYSDFSTEVANKTPSEFIVFHDAYNYMFKSIGLDQDNKLVFSENVMHELGTSHMAELIDEVQMHWVKYMFREPQFQNKNLESFASQYSLSLDVLDPLGTDSWSGWYIANLQANLKNIKKVYE